MVVYGMKGGESQQSEPILLDQPVNNKAPFHAGANDEFKVRGSFCFIVEKQLSILSK